MQTTFTKLLYISSLTMLLCACSSITVLESPGDYDMNITGNTLFMFKDTNIAKYKFHGSGANAEFEKIKNLVAIRKNDLIPSGIYTYAFVKGKDTIYANYRLNFWKYKNSSTPLTSPVFNAKAMNQTETVYEL